MTKTKTVTKYLLDYLIFVSDLYYCLVVSVCLMIAYLNMHETLSNKKWSNSIDFIFILFFYFIYIYI